MTELADTRERGYAECAGELEPALYGVSAPILNSDGRPLGGLQHLGAGRPGSRCRVSPSWARWRSGPQQRSARPSLD